MSEEDVMVAWLVTLGAVVPCHLYFHARLREILRQSHPDVWKDLGSPTIFLNNSIANTWSVQRFIHSGKYRLLNDPELCGVARKCRVTDVLGYGINLVGFVALALL